MTSVRHTRGAARRIVLAAALAITAFVAFAGPAQAADRRCVNAPSAYIRNYPQGAAWTQLYVNQTFTVYEYRASGWARGYAHGHVNTDRSPYISWWDYASYPNAYDVWIQESALGKHVNDGSAC